MAKRKKTGHPKKVKQRIGRSLHPAVSGDLILQQFETSKTIKNYDTAGLPYNKKVYDSYVRNMEAQKVASQHGDSNLKIKLANHGKRLFKELKESAGNPSRHMGDAVAFRRPATGARATRPVAVSVRPAVRSRTRGRPRNREN